MKMVRRSVLFWFLLVAAGFYPAVAYADLTTLGLSQNIPDLLINNFVIGIVEGIIIAVLFKQRWKCCIGLMILANWFSAAAGEFLFVSPMLKSVDIDLYNVWQWISVMVVVGYLTTLVLEWPFVAFCFRGSGGWFRRSLWATLISQTASTLLVIGLYYFWTDTSLYRELVVVPPSEISLPKNAVVYYIAKTDGNVYSLGSSSREPTKVCKLKDSGDRASLFVRESGGQPGHWDIVVGTDRQGSTPRTVREGLLCEAVKPFQPGGGQPGRGDIPRIGDANRAGWKFSYDMLGLRGENIKDGRMLRFHYFSAPFVLWGIWHPTQLPNGQVIFQLGNQQICLLDPDSRKIAVIAKGYCPVLTITKLDEIPKTDAS